MYRIPNDMRAEIARQYTMRLPDGTWKGSKLIARDLGISDTAIRNILREMGVPIRSAKEAHAHGKRCGPIKHTEQLNDPPLCACGCGQPTYWTHKYRWAKYVEGHYRKDAPYKNEAWLCQQYKTLRVPIPKIATMCGVNVSTIIKFMKKFGIDRRPASESHKGTQAGPKNPAWKGGVTPERQRIYKQGGWREFVKQIYARDGYICQRCKQGVSGSGKRGVAAHHVKPWADHSELRFDPTNVITLCRKCHHWVHSKANTARDFLG